VNTARDPHRRRELGREDTHPDGKRAVGRGERDEGLGQRDRHDRVEEQRRPVHDDEDAREQREEAVHLLDGEPRPGELDAAGHQRPDHDRR
jgi:hypothetical protein